MTDWIEHDGGPQPVGDDVWICIDAMPDEMEEVGAGYVRLSKRVASWKNVTGFFILNQHLIDAARREGIRLGLEAAAWWLTEIANAADQPESKTLLAGASRLRDLNADSLARESVLDQLTSEAQHD
jgi:hypothetical protein